MVGDRDLKSIMNDLLDDTNNGSKQFQHGDEIGNLPKGQKINRISDVNRSQTEAGQRVLDF